MTEIMSFISERVPSETDNMPSVGATESVEIFEQFPDFVVQFEVLCLLLRRLSAAGMNILVSLIEIIEG